MQIKLVLSNVGKLLILIGASMLIPLITAIIYSENCWWVFAVSAAITIGFGILLIKLFAKYAHQKLSIQDSYLLVTLTWFFAALLGMLPYLLAGTFSEIINAFFESMSGITTVGASVLDNVEAQPHGILMWRSTTQWLGGMGILVLFIAVLPGTSALQMYKAESMGPVMGKLLPKASDTARSLWLIYLLNTMLIFALYVLAGMNVFDAINHSFTTVATGGFSTRNASIAAYQNAAIEWVAILGMFMGGINYSLYFYVLHNRRVDEFKKSLEFKVYLGVIVLFTMIIYSKLLIAQDYSVFTGLRHSIFQVLTIITTTGYASCDFDQWSLLARYLLLILMMVGACSGSTTCGMKIDRHIILFQKMRYEVEKFFHPRMVSHLRLKGEPLDNTIVLRTTTFFNTYILIAAISIYLLACMDIGLMECVSGTLSCLGGVGPAMGQWGPSETYSMAPAGAKLVLSALMLLGRLEIYPVLVSCLPLLYKRVYQEKLHFED